LTVEKTINSSDIVFFFGAGASAPFNIPTMKQFVTDFEKVLEEDATKSERLTYKEIKDALEKRLKRQVDIEAVFTVIDGIINYSPERLGFLSLYCATKFDTPNSDKKLTCTLLRRKFRNFVSSECCIPQEAFSKIKEIYHDFFNRFALELGNYNENGKYAYNSNWTMFTTNYDLCLEYYWREVAHVAIDTGFDFERVRNVTVLRPYKLLQESTGLIQLFKLHGSVDWLIEKGTNDVIEVETAKGQSHMGRKYKGEMMLYPIAEKELYLDPYVSMILRLNRELEKKSTWVVIGYSFADPVIREIFLRKFNSKKKLVLVHKKASEVYRERLSHIKGDVSLMEKQFGMENTFRQTNHQIMHKLKDNPVFKASEEPLP